MNGSRNRQRLLAAFALAFVLSAGSATPSRAAHYADEVAAGKLNTSGRPMMLTVPLDDGGRRIGEVAVRVDPDDTIFVSKSSLIERFGTELKSGVLQRLSALPELVSLAQLARAGVPLEFDRQAVALRTALTADQRKDGDISLATASPPGSAVTAKPARVAAYNNFYVDVSHFWGTDDTTLTFTDEARLRIADFVFEDEFIVENGVNPSSCPTNALCVFDHVGGIKRQGTRLVYDVPASFNRFTLGDTHTSSVDFGSANDVLGITLDHSPARLDPTHPIRGTGASSFRLERPAAVEVIINGVAVQRMQLPAGTYNLRDLPLHAGANDIALQITDDTGAARTLSFTAYSGTELLSPGKAEWSLSGGVPSYFNDGAIEYYRDEFLVGGFGRYGVTSALSIEGSAQADRHVALGGGGFAMSTPLGLFGVRGSASESSAGLGAAGRLTWEIAGKNDIDTLRLAAELHSPDFRTPGQFDLPLTGVLVPTYQFRQSYTGTYSRRLPDQWQVTLSGRYDVADPNYYAFAPLSVRGDRYDGELTLSHPVFTDATLSGTVGYSNEIYSRSLTATTLASDLADTRGAVWAGLRLYWRPTDKLTVTASTDTLNQRSSTTGTYLSGTGVDSWSTTVTATDDRVLKTSGVSASAAYRGERIEAAISHNTGFNSYIPGGPAFALEQQQSSVRLGTALVYADGHTAVSAPVRGDGGFAILYPHESIGDREILVGTRDNRLAHSDLLGPPVVANLPAYSPQSLPIDVVGLPVGYSLGSGGFDLMPSYRDGYALEVGSDHALTAFGTLIGRDGKPLVLASGTISNGSRTVAVFTNQTGRFAADGLSSGPWTITMGTESGPISYRISIPKGQTGLVKVGELAP